MERLKAHHLREGGLSQSAIAEQLKVSVSSVERILAGPKPGRDEVLSGRPAGPRPGRPSTTEPFRERLVAFFAEEASHVTLPATEVLRRSRAWGYEGGRSAMLELIASVRPVVPKEPLVRFEGVPGEFAQFDFGEVRIQFENGRRMKVVFFVGRLKFSRYVHVVVTPNQQAEAFIRALVACLAAFGGAPKEWVFDNPKTVRTSKPDEPVKFHPYLLDIATEMNVLPTLCTPRTPQQKGSVESAVKFVKRGFFLVRKFRDEADMQEQLGEWLHEVNCVRVCSATGEVPEVLRQQELPRLVERPLRWTADDYPLRLSATISPVATVTYAGTPYGAPVNRIGAPATLFVRAGSIELCINDERCIHTRRDGVKAAQRHPHQRTELLAVVHGRRKQSYYRRQCILELGVSARDFLEELIHRSPGGTWSPTVDALFDLLQAHGADALLLALQAAHEEGRHDALAVARALRRVA